MIDQDPSQAPFEIPKPISRLRSKLESEQNNPRATASKEAFAVPPSQLVFDLWF
jgi:hypothetical protein